MILTINHTDYKIPSSWSMLSSRQIRTILKRSKLDMQVAKLVVLEIFLPAKIFHKIKPIQMHDIIAEMDWMDEMDTACGIESIRIFGRLHNMAAPKLENATANEFVLADDYYQKFMESHQVKYLNLLCATLCRPSLTGSKAIELEDNRIPIVSRLQIERSAWKWKFIRMWKKFTIIAYFSACKLYIHNTYGPYLFSGSGESEGQAKSTGINFGWLGAFMTIAENGIFGSYEEVMRTRFHTLAYYMLKKNQDQKEAEAAAKKN